MELKIFDKELEPLGIVDETKSVIWQPTYWAQGAYDDCKILAPVTTNNSKLLVKGNIVVLHGEAADFTDEQGKWRRAMQITYKYITKDENGAELIEVQGCFLKKWLSKRVILVPKIIRGTNQSIITTLVAENIGEGADAARQFENFTMLAQEEIAGEQVDFTTVYGTDLGEVIYDRALSSKLGYDILVNERVQQYGFWLYKGADMSSGNSAGNKPCIFSRDRDNVIEQEYTESIENIKNVCFATSAADENNNIFTQVVDAEGKTGADRDEMFIDLSSISWDTTNEQGVTSRISRDQYIQLMLTEMGAQLDEASENINFESTIDTSKNLQFKRDFLVGTIVTSIEKSWGIRIDARITRVSQTWQDGKHTLVVTFGDSLPTLLDKIKKARK